MSRQGTKPDMGLKKVPEFWDFSKKGKQKK
jgi:hypothetical protein